MDFNSCLTSDDNEVFIVKQRLLLANAQIELMNKMIDSLKVELEEKEKLLQSYKDVLKSISE